jgi:hypothetical protein
VEYGLIEQTAHVLALVGEMPWPALILIALPGFISTLSLRPATIILSVILCLVAALTFTTSLPPERVALGMLSWLAALTCAIAGVGARHRWRHTEEQLGALRDELAQLREEHEHSLLMTVNKAPSGVPPPDRHRRAELSSMRHSE